MNTANQQSCVGEPMAGFFDHCVNAEGLDRVLNVVRRHLGMDVAFISRFRSNDRVLQFVDGSAPCPLHEGQAIPLEEGYCLKVVRGELPEFIPDTACVPGALAIPATNAIPIGSHLSVPVRLSDRRVFGTLCCFSYRPNRALNERDMQVLRAFAEFLGFYFETVAKTEEEKESTIAQVRAVITSDALRIVFQPVYEIASLKLHGFECLSRFDFEPLRSPDKWFNAAHRADPQLGLDLELHAIKKALDAQHKLRPEIALNINGSPELLLAGKIQSILAQPYDLINVVLEITEHAAVPDYDALAKSLKPFRDRGVKLAIDDAGAGYSSMRHILHLEPDIIKLDTSLTQSVDTDKKRKALAKGLISFAHEIGSLVVAEGVETVAELSTLAEFNVDYVQGYLLGKPLDLELAMHLPSEHRLN